MGVPSVRGRDYRGDGLGFAVCRQDGGLLLYSPMNGVVEEQHQQVPVPGMHPQGHSGASTGLNIEPGSDDDGWVVPDPVTLGDGTVVQLYKDGEALHAAYEAIKAARKRI